MTALRAKRRANVVIVLFLALLVLSPLSYYTVRSDRFDERFAWRMFSSTRMVQCSVNYYVGASRSALPLYKYFHEAWVDMGARGKRMVLDAMTEKLCEDNAGHPIRLRQGCRHVDGKVTVEFDGRKNLCKGPGR